MLILTRTKQILQGLYDLCELPIDSVDWFCMDVRVYDAYSFELVAPQQLVDYIKRYALVFHLLNQCGAHSCMRTDDGVFVMYRQRETFAELEKLG